MSAAPRSKRPRRLYNTDFPVHRAEPRLRVEIDRVPRQLYTRVRRAATSANLSLRALTLRLWSQWLAQQRRRPDAR